MQLWKHLLEYVVSSNLAADITGIFAELKFWHCHSIFQRLIVIYYFQGLFSRNNVKPSDKQLEIIIPIKLALRGIKRNLFSIKDSKSKEYLMLGETFFEITEQCLTVCFCGESQQFNIIFKKCILRSW